MCPRCHGIVVRDWGYEDAVWQPLLRCLICCWMGDPVMEYNRAHPAEVSEMTKRRKLKDRTPVRIGR